MAVASGIEYIMYPGSLFTKTHILESKNSPYQRGLNERMYARKVAEDSKPYGKNV